VLLIELNAWEDEWLVGILQALQEGKKPFRNQQKKILKSDLVFGQIINTCNLGANWNGQNFLNHKRWFFKKIKS